jgi:hypothetical protein
MPRPRVAVSLARIGAAVLASAVGARALRTVGVRDGLQQQLRFCCSRLASSVCAAPHVGADAPRRCTWRNEHCSSCCCGCAARCETEHHPWTHEECVQTQTRGEAQSQPGGFCLRCCLAWRAADDGVERRRSAAEVA